MPPPSRSCRRVAVIAVIAALATAAHADEPAATYVVKDGDSCMSIAVTVLGDRRALAELHRQNPQLGKLPHHLVAGQVIHLPRTDAGPDARLTGKSGDVRFRDAVTPAWDAARRGMDLFRAWRVGAEPRASAEVTFRDTQKLTLRENTIVIIYGPERRRARTAAPEAVLERGTLRSRLAELAGKPPPPLRVTTPSARAVLGSGSAVIGVSDDGRSMVANHDGRAIDLRGTGGGRVAVTANMGTRVARGQRPEKPRRLPPAPTWVATGPTHFVAVDGVAALRGAWRAVPTAAEYRFEILHGSLVIAAGEVPATVTGFVVENAPAGDYQVQVASIDVDRLEGRPSPALTMVVRGVAIADPGAEVPTIAIPRGDAEPIAAAAAAAGAAKRVAIGARVVTGGAMGCSVDGGGAPAAVTVLDAAALVAVRCVGADGAAFAPFELAVQPLEVAGAGRIARGDAAEIEVTLRSLAPLGDGWQLEPSPGLTVDGTTRTPTGLRARVTVADDAPAPAALRVVDATTQRTAGTLAIELTAGAIAAPAAIPVAPRPDARARPPRLTVGAFGGWLHLPTGRDGNQLGNAPLAAYVVDSGPGVGLRAAWWLDGRMFVEAELAVTPTRFVGADELAWVYGGHGHLGVRALDRGRVSVRVVGGGGVFALRSDAVADDVDLDLDYGVGVSYQLDPSLRVRLDGRHHLVPDRTAGGVANAFQLNAGVELVLAPGR